MPAGPRRAPPHPQKPTIAGTAPAEAAPPDEDAELLRLLAAEGAGEPAAAGEKGRNGDPEPEPGPGGSRPHYHGHRQRLRGRLLRRGAGALEDYEILEVLLAAAIPRQDVKPLAKRLIDQFGSLGAVLNADPAQLMRKTGVKESTAALLAATAEACRRMLREAVVARPVIGGWGQLLDYLQLAMKYEPAEQFRLLFLDRKNVLIADEVQQRGTVDQAPVYPREVVKRALELHACAVILVHNHPSGDPTPSKADIDMTRTLAGALSAVGVTVHDHIIVGRQGHASFKGLGLL